MPIVLEKLTEVQDGVLDAIVKVKEPAVKTVTTVVDLITERVPELPTLTFGKEIPTPAELITNQHKFAKSVIDINKDIALAIAKAAAPVTDKVLDRKAVRAAAAPKATARKAS